MKKLASIIIALLLLVGCFAACSEPTSSTGPSTTTPITESESVSESIPVTTEGGPGLDLDRTFDGYTYNILQHTGTAGLDFQAEEDSSDVILSADFARHVTVEATLDVEIELIELSAGKRDGAAALATYLLSGTNPASLATLSSYSAGNALLEGLLTDLNTIPHLDLTREWWDQSCVQDCTFGEKVYFMTGDISYIDNNQTFAIQFNKKLATDYNIPNLYEYVDNQTWTLDTLLQVAQIAASVEGDLNGNSNHTNDPEDLYPIWTWDDAVMGFINTAGIKCMSITDAGKFELTLSKDNRLFTVFDKFSRILYDTNLTCAYQRNGYAQSYGLQAFQQDRGLFYFSNIWICTLLRDMESDYGVLPFPMYDESQTEYLSPIAPFNMHYYVVPTILDDEALEAIGYVTQLLGYESMIQLTPAYYEKTLQQKGTRDEDSKRMVDLILKTRVHDFGWFYEIGGYNEGVMNLFRSYSNDLMSMLDASREAALGRIDEINGILQGSLT